MILIADSKDGDQPMPSNCSRFVPAPEVPGVENVGGINQLLARLL
jgi:hypothetical protein